MAGRRPVALRERPRLRHRLLPRPPFRLPFATDLNLPHWWEIFGALAAPVQRNQESSLLQFLVGASFYTWREAARVRRRDAARAAARDAVRPRLLERAFVPYVVASQTIPIVALAPMIVFAFGPSVTSVVVIATYLTFFPVTIAMIRGLRSPDPRRRADALLCGVEVADLPARAFPHPCRTCSPA